MSTAFKGSNASMLAGQIKAAQSRRKSRSPLPSLFLPIADVLTMIACISMAGLINASFDNFTDVRGAILLLLIGGCIVAFQQLGHYSRRRQFWQEVGDIAALALVALLLDAALLYLAKINFSRLWVMTGWMLVAIVVPFARLLVKRFTLTRWKQPTVIIGTGPLARETAEAYSQNAHFGYDVVTLVEPDAVPGSGWTEMDIAGRTIPVRPLDESTMMLPALFDRTHVVVALELDQLPQQESLLEKLSLYHGDIDIISPVRGLPINNARTSHFFSYDILSLRISNNLARPWSQVLKRLFDIVAASALVVFLAPVMVILAIAVGWSGGPVFFAHTRVGRGGQLFQCLKFRSMVPNSAEVLARLLAEDEDARREWQETYKLKKDPRITAFGHFLRKSSLDELPQLFNVLRGDMSLVGPRPVVPDELERYGDAKVYYLEVRPGLTGLWQISGRSDLDYERRVSLDTWYVRNWTLWYDILILFKTVLVVPAKAGAY